MLDYTSRLLTAFIISTSCFLATVLWYRSAQKQDLGQVGKTPIARLDAVVNEVQRKPLARVIWEKVSRDQQLYSGEAIRTSLSSTARIVFEDSGTIIDLEPESLVVLELNSLDFKQGNLLVKNSGTGQGGASSLVLKSGDNRIDLKNAELSLSKTESGSVDLEVFKGQLEVQRGTQTVVLDKTKAGTLSETGLDITQNRIQVRSPLPGDLLYINAEKREPILFQFEKLPAGYKVFLERGPNRTRLGRVEDIPAEGPNGELKIPLKVGRYYWRLVAESEDPKLERLESSVFPLIVEAKSAPLVLEPIENAQLVVPAQNPKIDIRWASRSQFENFLVEFATDPNLKTVIKQEYVDNKLSFAEIPLTQSGTLYMRLTGFIKIKDKLEPVSSEIRKFQLKVGIDLIPPKLRSPLPAQNITFQQVTNQGLLLSWDEVAGIEDFQITIEANKKDGSELFLEQKTSTVPFRLSEIPSGTYSWFVQSIGPDKKISASSEKRSFTISDMPRLEWADSGARQYPYITPQPSLMLGWKSSPIAVSKWRYRYALSSQMKASTPWLETKQTQFSAQLPEDGTYSVEVEGLDEKGRTISKTDLREIQVVQKPLLPGPRFSKDLPEVLQADRRGDLSLQWENVEGASLYRIFIKDESGQEVLRESPSDRNIASIKKLKPGKYKVHVQAVDEYKRDGAEGEVRDLEVPKTSDIKAPTFKKLNVK